MTNEHISSPVPCEFTDVTINASTPFSAVISTGIAYCRGILLKSGATLRVSPDAKLNVTIQQ